MDYWEEGRIGEGRVRDLLKAHKIHYLQADLLVKTKYGWQIYEIKHQEPFKAPPFDGHGLPKWQLDSRLQFQK